MSGEVVYVIAATELRGPTPISYPVCPPPHNPPHPYLHSLRAVAAAELGFDGKALAFNLGEGLNAVSHWCPRRHAAAGRR